MILTSLFTVVLATLASTVSAQDDTQGPINFDAIHNATTIYGTWSSGSRQVLTGPVSCIFTALLMSLTDGPGLYSPRDLQILPT